MVCTARSQACDRLNLKPPCRLSELFHSFTCVGISLFQICRELVRCREVWYQEGCNKRSFDCVCLGSNVHGIRTRILVRLCSYPRYQQELHHWTSHHRKSVTLKLEICKMRTSGSMNQDGRDMYKQAWGQLGLPGSSCINSVQLTDKVHKVQFTDKAHSSIHMRHWGFFEGHFGEKGASYSCLKMTTVHSVEQDNLTCIKFSGDW
jgi:hypothetical protein